MLDTGAIRRIGAVPNHYRLGLRGNGMSVWDIDDHKADALGARIGALKLVSHCYLRPRRPPLWPYNLFAMVHGRFTLTRDNAAELPDLLRLMDDEGIEKFYLSHLNYAGRGYKNRGDDLHHRMTRHAMELLFNACWDDTVAGRRREFVTGNNDAVGPWLLHWAARTIPSGVPRLRAMLESWGGNASGINIANIDNEGRVHPDTMWWDYSLGKVTERPFSSIWEDRSDPLMAGLKQRPRPLAGRCAQCAHLAICGGNSRTRPWRLTGDPWAPDPGCYLTDVEIGLAGQRTDSELQRRKGRKESRRPISPP